MELNRHEHAADLELARAASEGSLPAWHEFVNRYSGLIRSIVRRYMAVCDDDDQRSTYVGCLEFFYRTALARFDGRASLGTWVMTVTRNRCLDALRSRGRRRRAPAWLQSLPPEDREIYRLHCLEGRGYEAIAEEFARRGRIFSPEAFSQSRARLEARMDRGLRTRMAYELQARSTGDVSGRMLEFLDHLRLEQQEQAEAFEADFNLIQAQARQLLEQVRECVAQLEDPEGGVIRLHFYDGLAAPEIARRMALPSPRRVYALIDRGVRTLRYMLRPTVLRPEKISRPEGEG